MSGLFDWFKSSSKKPGTDDTTPSTAKKRKDFPGLILSLMKEKTFSGYYPKPDSELPSKPSEPKNKPKA